MNQNKRVPGTRYAPAEKADYSDILNSYNLFKNDTLLNMYHDAMPDIAVIINKQRQLVYANHFLLEFLDMESDQLLLGERFGKLVECIHAEETEAGCGTTESCRFCGIVNAILDSQKLKKPIVKEARVTAGRGEETVSYDFIVKASPLTYHQEEYTIVCLHDISDRKRRSILETSYFNEVYDSASELQQMVSTIKEQEHEEENLPLIEAVEKVNYGLMEDILAQRMLSDAEEGTLVPEVSRCNPVQILKELQQYFLSQQVASGKKLYLDPFTHSMKFESDINLVKRVLINILTNAFEAIDEGLMVKAGARLDNRVIRFWVYSPAEMTEAVKHQVFQRSFSTKATNRGIGTYTARLITVKYLKGKIYFTSDSKGTNFYVEVPLKMD